MIIKSSEGANPFLGSAIESKKRSESTLKRADLYSRGWTAGLIKKHLCVAKVEHRHLAPYRYSDVFHYRLSDVEQAAALPEVRAKLTANLFRRANTTPETKAKRSASAKAAVATKHAETLIYASECPITVQVVPEDELREWARITYLGNYQGHREYPGFNDRTAVNCIRHRFTNYARQLSYLEGRVATDKAYFVLKRRILDEIAKHYPHYAAECREQAFNLELDQRRQAAYAAAEAGAAREKSSS